MNTLLTVESSLPRVSSQSPTAAISANDVNDLLASKILISGTRMSDLAYLQTMLSLSGFTNLAAVSGQDKLMQLLRQSIHDDQSEIDLIILDCRLGECNARELRLKLDQFDEWRLIPVIALTEKSQWNHNQLLTDLGYGVTSLLYRPLTAESLPPAVMTTLAAKRERDHYHQRQQQIEDENAQLRVMEARLQFSVNHDDLTGLANRRRLEHALDITLTQVRNFHTSSALFYIDLDSFKVLNDAEGHEAGDALLVQVANSLRGFFKVRDTLVRIGSDEFAVLVDTIDPETAVARAEGLRELFDGYSFTFHDHHYHLSASIGVKCITEADNTTVGAILSHANQACYTAKNEAVTGYMSIAPAIGRCLHYAIVSNGHLVFGPR